MTDEYQAIGETAGEIYKLLNEKGQQPLTKLQKELKIQDAKLMHQAIGWLAREEKIAFGKKGKAASVGLI